MSTKTKIKAKTNRGEKMATKTKVKIQEAKKEVLVIQEPISMPGYEKYHKPCDIEVAENTLKRFVEAETPSKKGTHLALLAFLSTQITTEATPIAMVFSILNKKLGITINAKAGDRFRTILYNDYYPQTRPPKEVEVKGTIIKKYQWDNHIYCIVPLTLEPEHNAKKLWGFKFKPEFVEMASKIKIDSKKLVEHSDKL